MIKGRQVSGKGLLVFPFPKSLNLSSTGLEIDTENAHERDIMDEATKRRLFE